MTRVEHGLRNLSIPPDEDGQQHGATGSGPCCGDALRCLSRDDQEGQSSGEEPAPGHVESRGLMFGSVRRLYPRRDPDQPIGEHDHRDVGDEHGAPSKTRRELPAQ